jgi:thiol:disulfide interchange protein
MNERAWLWAAVIAGGVMLGVLFARQDKNLPVDTTNNGWTPSSKSAPAFEPANQKKAIQPLKPQLKVNDYEGLLKIAKEQNKQLVLFFTAKHCQYCQTMKSDVLTRTAVKEALSQNLFYIVDLDKEPGFMKKYNITLLPTFLIVQPILFLSNDPVVTVPIPQWRPFLKMGVR